MVSQGIFWLLTIPHHGVTPQFTTLLSSGCAWIRGQLERGDITGYYHWQVIVAFSLRQRLRGVKSLFGDECHAELSRSSAASEYVWKESTRIQGTQFELGARPILRSSKVDWESVWTNATMGRIEAIPAHIRVLSYSSILRIRANHQEATDIFKTIYVYYGVTGSGKSYLARASSTTPVYNKDPRSKFWYGYKGEKTVVVDEFRGGIDISHILRWTDNYAIYVELKGSHVPLEAEKIIFTSNKHPKEWWLDVDEETYNAFLRRVTITHFPNKYIST